MAPVINRGRRQRLMSPQSVNYAAGLCDSENLFDACKGSLLLRSQGERPVASEAEGTILSFAPTTRAVATRSGKPNSPARRLPVADVEPDDAADQASEKRVNEVIDLLERPVMVLF